MQQDVTKALTVVGHTMDQVASIVDDVAKSVTLTDYQERQSKETLRRQKNDLESFEAYLSKAGLVCGDLLNDLSAWHGVSMGFVEGYKRWMIEQGYAIGTINVRLATVKRYIALAVKAGYVPESNLAMIRLVKGYLPKEGRHLDEKRPIARQEKSKKAHPTLLSIEQAEALKRQKKTRDRLIMCLFIDHGFRCGEVAGLKVDSIHMSARQIIIYRPKVDKEGTQDLSRDTYNALVDYLNEFHPTEFLFPGETALNGLEGSYGVRAINKRVGVLGRNAGIANLSPHDLRHFWAWYAAYRGIPINRLQQAGGWSSLEMPNRYIGKSQIENEGMV